jgi:hypothetical protein
MVSAILSSSLFSEEIKIDDIYEVYISKSTKIDLTNIKKDEVYFGRYEEYLKKVNEDNKEKIAKQIGNGATTGLSAVSNSVSNNVANSATKNMGQGLGMGLAIGAVYGLGEYFYNKATETEVFILVNDYTNDKNEKTRIVALYGAEDFDDEPIVKNFLNQEIEKKYNIKGTSL